MRRDHGPRYREKELARARVLGGVLSALVLVCAAGYLAWCFSRADWNYWYATGPFFLAETAFLVLLALWVGILRAKRLHRPGGPPNPPPDLSVDVLIPCRGEPVTMIRKTLEAAMRIDYPRLAVFVLDDGDSDEMREMVLEQGAGYFRRDVHDDRKAGNLNYALARTSGDLVLTLDADQVVEPAIVRETIGYFAIPRIGFVQTKQRFAVPRGDPWGNADTVFYEAMMPGKDWDNSAISCGTGVLYRRSALQEVGGFSTWNLVEDVHTSMLLHDRGWRSVYHGTAYATGTAPTEMISYTTQRWQWAVDALRIFFWDNPLFRKGLTWQQRVQYFHFGYHYLCIGCALPIFLVLPIWALFTHHFMLAAPVWMYMAVRAPYFISHLLVNRFLTDGTNNFKVFQVQAGLFGAYFDAALTALACRRRPPGYTVTRKAALQTGIGSRFFRCSPHLLIVVASVAAIVWGLVNIRSDPWFLTVNVFWALWVIAVLGRFVVLSLAPRLLFR